MESFDHPVQPTSSELTLSNSEVVDECDHVLDKPERRKSTSTDTDRSKTDDPKRYSTTESPLRRNTAPAISLAGINSLKKTALKPLLAIED